MFIYALYNTFFSFLKKLKKVLYSAYINIKILFINLILLKKYSLYL
jgi:Na+-driven multidrug efflux pump